LNADDFRVRVTYGKPGAKAHVRISDGASKDIAVDQATSLGHKRVSRLWVSRAGYEQGQYGELRYRVRGSFHHP
jgi:hypothetical protein